MKNTILIKHHPSVQLAHLYEHLFLMQANELLNQRGLFKWIDYTLNGTTYENGGIIAVDFRAYNEAAEAFLVDIMQIHLELEEPQLTKALMQLHAEEYYELKQGSYSAIAKHLNDIDAMQWQSLDLLEVLNTKEIKRTSMPLHLTNTESKSPIITKVSLELDHHFADANPLTIAVFTIVARAVLMTATYTIAKNTGSYSFQIYSQLSGRRVVVELLTANKFRSHTPEFNMVIEEIRATVNLMIQHGAFKRLADDLQNTSYYLNGSQAPDYEQLLNDAGVLVGSKGWEMVDQKLIQEVMNNITIDVRRSRKSTRVLLVDSKNK